MVLTIHHLGHGQSDRVVILCEELGIPYELKKYARDPLAAPADYKALFPTGAAPVIEDGSVKLGESTACVEYILTKFGNGKLVVKPDQPHYADYLYWLHFANGTFQPANSLFMYLTVFTRDLPSDHPVVSRVKGRLEQLLKIFDARVAEHTWLAGDEFTAADVMNIFTLTTMREFSQVDLSAYPNLIAYIQRVVARPAYQRAYQKGDPDIDIAKISGGPPPPLFAGFQKA